MNGIPVSATIADAYRFAFGHLPAVIGVVWFPYLVLYGFIFGLPALLGSNPIDFMFSQFYHPQPLTPWYMLGIRVLPYIIGAIISVGVLNRALGLSTGPSLVYFSLGKPVWRMIAAKFFGTIILVAGMFAIVIPGAVVIGVTAAIAAKSQSSDATVAVLVCVLVLAMFAVMIYFGLRLLFLLGPVVVAEKRIGIERSWQLSKGHGGQLFLVALGTFLPITILIFAIWGAQFALALPDLTSFFHTLKMPDNVDDLSQVQALDTMRTLLHTVFAHFGNQIYIWLGVSLLLGAITTGLGAGAAASAYRALVPPVPGDE